MSPTSRSSPHRESLNRGTQSEQRFPLKHRRPPRFLRWYTLHRRRPLYPMLRSIPSTQGIPSIRTILSIRAILSIRIIKITEVVPTALLNLGRPTRNLQDLRNLPRVSRAA